jgi:hypothetical protein
MSLFKWHPTILTLHNDTAPTVELHNAGTDETKIMSDEQANILEK